MQQLGFELDEIELNRVFEEFKALADRKKELFDGDIEALVLPAENAPWVPGAWSIWTSRRTPAHRRASPCGWHTRMAGSLERKATGDGPVDAAFKAIVLATGISVTLRKFEVHAVTTGEDAQGEAVLYVEHNGRSYRGSSISTDIVEAANRALLEVINRIELSRQAGRQSGERPRDDRPPQSHGAKRRLGRSEGVAMPIPATPYIWFNGKLVAWEKATVHVLTHALHYGSSVFEGVRAYAVPKGVAIFRLRDHTRRLFDSAKIYRIECRSRPISSTMPAVR